MKVSYIDHMGSDLSVVNAARVSFGKKSETFTEGDAGLIRYLARGCTTGEWNSIMENFHDDPEYIARWAKKMPTHWTPFGHTAITLHIKVPIFVARQLGKHQVGMVWNEVSRRYVTDEPEFYTPEVWRKAAENVKQGSSDLPALTFKDVPQFNRDALELYYDLLNDGVCPEQARMVLPQSMYTEWYWTGNLYAFANVYIQRTDSHAQREVQEVARQIGDIIKPLFPVSWTELVRETMTDAPERIWLQTGDDTETGITWCDTEVEEGDDEYIRADIHEEEVTRLRRELEDGSFFKEADIDRILHERDEALAEVSRLRKSLLDEISRLGQDFDKDPD